jgi:putative acetyltransferase
MMGRMNALNIRAESSRDVSAIGDLVCVAHGRDAVSELVARIRSSPNYVADLALVATRGDRVVGFTMLSYVDLVDGDTRHRVLPLSPVSVVPDSQRQGIGSRLVMAAIAKADRRGEPLIVLEGSPDYYPRFGFRPSRQLGISINLPDWAPDDAAMARPLSAYDPDIRGVVVYPPAFDNVNADRGTGQAASSAERSDSATRS